MKVRINYTIIGEYTLDDSTVGDILEAADVDSETATDIEIIDAIKECEESGGLQDNINPVVDGKLTVEVTKLP